jgi:LysM repeat protein
VHIVKKGQTFDEIARSYKVSSDALARANPSAYPDKLLIGEKLNIPGRKAPASASVSAFKPGTSGTAKSGTHIVRPGQSLGAIAKSYGISTARLVAANKLKNPNLVEIGHVLVIPGGTATGNSNGAAPSRMTTRSTAPQVATHTRDTVPLPGAGMPLSKPAPVEPPVKPTPPAGFAPAFPASPSAPAPAPARKANLPVGSHRGVVAYRLERGDDIDSVANMFSTTSDKIRELNKLGPDAKMKEGDELIVPAMGPVSVD